MENNNFSLNEKLALQRKQLFFRWKFLCFLVVN